MRVLHVIPAVAQRYGGPSLAVLEICRNLTITGVETLIAATDADGRGRLPVEHGRTIDYRGITAIFFRRQWSEAYKYSHPLSKWIRRHVIDFDLVHIHAVFSHASLAAATAALNAGVPYLVRPLGSLNRWALGQKRFRKHVLWHAGVGSMLHNAQAIHYTSDSEKEQAEAALGLRRGVVIPLGVETPPHSDQEVPATDDCSSTPRYVLALGRLHPVKGLELLLDAFLDLVPRQFPGWKLKVVGNGEPAYVESLKQRVREKRGEEIIEFTGWLEGEAKAAALRGAALLAMPSQQENFGMAAFESLAHGVPVLVSDQIDLAGEIGAAGAGWVAPLQTRGLTETLADALADDATRAKRGRAGRKLVGERFGWPVVAARLNELYQDLVLVR